VFGSLTYEERELVYIAADVSLQHMHPGGLQMRYRDGVTLGVPAANRMTYRERPRSGKHEGFEVSAPFTPLLLTMPTNSTISDDHQRG
jgi:hypothetical protein